MSGSPPTPARAALMLVGVTFFWGMSFSWTHTWQKAAEGGADSLLSGLTLIGLRMSLALAALAAWQPRVVFGVTRREFAGGLLIGALFFAAFALQTWGLAYTTPALSAFFTSVCSAWVPLLCWLLFREIPRLLTLAGLGVGLAGCAVLVNGWHLNFGDGLTLIASVLFAVELIALDRVGKKMTPAHLSAGFFTAIGSLGILGAAVYALAGPGPSEWAGWTAGMLSRRESLFAVLALAVLPTAVAFHWMNAYQPCLSPSHAALIYLLEPVFSSLFSVLFGHDEVTAALLLGGALILAGNLLVEVPGWLSGKPGC